MRDRSRVSLDRTFLIGAEKQWKLFRPPSFLIQVRSGNGREWIWGLGGSAMASAQREAPLKAQGKPNPHIIILDAEQGVLNYLQRILSDRFQLSLFSEVA